MKGCIICGSKEIKVYEAEGERFELCRICYEREMERYDSLDKLTRFTVKPVRCPNCGTTWQDFRRSFLLGCAKCYDVFYYDLLPTVERTQGAHEHRGKVPEGSGEGYEHILELVHRRAELKSAVEAAVKRGDYAEANALGNELRTVKDEIEKVE